MKKATPIVNKKPIGRPRTVSADANGLAKAVAVRLPPVILAELERRATAGGKKISDVIRELVTAAVKPKKRKSTP